jgi:competence protein ComEA
MRRFIILLITLALSGFASVLHAELLDINTATEAQLADVMDGVGKVKAEAIVQDRDKNGKFKSVDDLERVKGIGKATIEKNRDKITVGSDAAVPAAAAPRAVAPAAAAAKSK